MPSASPAITALNAGELSPLMDGRTDFNKYASGCRVLRNFIPTVQGPIVQRAGTRYVGEAKVFAGVQRRAWLARFEFNVAAAYVIEFGHLYARFYTQHGLLTFGGGSPVDVATPWPESDLFDALGLCRLRVAQSGDFLYITHPWHEPQVLKRTSSTTFTVTPFRPKGGPFGEFNETAATLASTGQTGTVTITASAANTFSTGLENALILLESPSVSTTNAWEPGKAVGVGDVKRVGSRVYRAETAGTTGSLTPVHTEGSRVDGDGGVRWAFLHSGFGVARVTAQVNPTTVTAQVLTRLPHDAVAGTVKWAFSAWWGRGSNGVLDGPGWPSSVCFFRGRLCFARGNQVWMSVVDDYEDFSEREANGEITADMAITLGLAATDLNAIEWMVSGTDLLCGTAGGEFTIGELSNGDPLGPGNVRALKRSRFGSRGAQPVEVGQSVLFVQRAGRKVREVVLDENGYQSIDRTTLAEHATAGGVTDMDYAQEPDSVVWMAAAGSLIGFTWSAEQNVWAWHRHDVGGAVESIAVIPSPTGDRDEVWMIVRRTIGGATRRYVEYMEARLGDSQDTTAAFYVDSGLSYSGPAVSTLGALSHLEGKEVAVHVNGAPHPRRTVLGGAITLDEPATNASVGLPMTAIVCPMRIDAGSATGTSQGKTKRMHKVVWRFHRTVTGRAGPALDKLEEMDFRQPEDLMDTPVPMLDRDFVMAWPGGYDTDGFMFYVNDSTLPASIVAIYPQVVTSDAR